jgi:hypothetical protein
MSDKLQTIIGGLFVICASLVVWGLIGNGFAFLQRIQMIGFSGAANNMAEKPVIRLSPVDQMSIEVAGLNTCSLSRLKRAKPSSADWAKFFVVHTGSKVISENPPMLGDYSIVDNAVRFTPRFPLVQGLTYTARFDTAFFEDKFGPSQPEKESSTQPVIETRLEAPKGTAKSTTIVTQIYPSADKLPANQLKFYIRFSSPMNLGEAYQHVRLIDESGKEVSDVFLRIDQELWDSTRERFTLLLDPGRIKRGLRSNLEDGSPLRGGKSYRLVIDGGWRDGNGNLLGKEFEKRFMVIDADRTSPNYRTWKFIAPSAGTLEPLKLILDEPLDRALLEQMIEVFSADGRRLEGRVEISGNEKEWHFVPKAVWSAGSYSVRVDAKIEDRAGNNLKHLFDVDLIDKRSRRLSPEQVQLKFEVVGK